MSFTRDPLALELARQTGYAYGDIERALSILAGAGVPAEGAAAFVRSAAERHLQPAAMLRAASSHADRRAGAARRRIA
jgi:hypothetical protein